VLMMQLYPAILSVTLGSWLVLQYGLAGACTAAFLASLLRAATGLYYVSRIEARRSAPLEIPLLDDSPI